MIPITEIITTGGPHGRHEISPLTDKKSESGHAKVKEIAIFFVFFFIFNNNNNNKHDYIIANYTKKKINILYDNIGIVL